MLSLACSFTHSPYYEEGIDVNRKRNRVGEPLLRKRSRLFSKTALLLSRYRAQVVKRIWFHLTNVMEERIRGPHASWSVSI